MINIHIINTRICCSDTQFYLGDLGSQCSLSGIVSEFEECRDAGNELGRNFDGTKTTKDRPAGCYYWSTNNNVYFNLANLSDAQYIHSKSGGVCKRGILYDCT